MFHHFPSSHDLGPGLTRGTKAVHNFNVKHSWICTIALLAFLGASDARAVEVSCLQDGNEVCSDAKFKLAPIAPDHFTKILDGRKEVFATWLKPAALYVQAITGIPASLVIAQAGLASDWGAGEAFRNYNNLFSHVCWSPGAAITGELDLRGTLIKYKGICGKEKTVGQVGKFIKFSSREDSILAYLHFVAISPSRFFRQFQDDIRSGIKRQPIRAPSFRSTAQQMGAFSSETNYVGALLHVIQQEKLPAIDDFQCWRCLIEGPKPQEKAK